MTAGPETRPSSTAAAPSRLGPFEILGRKPGEDDGGAVTLSVEGSEGSAFAGRRGVARCFALPTDEAGRERLRSMLGSLVALDHPVIAAPVDADLSGDIAYVVDVDPPPGNAGSAQAQERALPPSRVAEYLLPIAAALETARRAGLSHGSLSPSTVLIGGDGPVIGGWSGFGRGSEADQHDLALLAVDWLAGAPFIGPPDAGDPESRERRRERLRAHLDGVTERLVAVVARASETSPEERYGSVTDFVAAFQVAVTQSGEELVQAGFEAISGRSPELARFLANSARRYDADAPGLDLLNLQLGAPAGDSTSLREPGHPSESARVMAGLDPALTVGIPPEMLAMIAPPIPLTTKPRNNPWLVMIVGIGGLTLLLLAGAIVVLFTGSR